MQISWLKINLLELIIITFKIREINFFYKYFKVNYIPRYISIYMPIKMLTLYDNSCIEVYMFQNAFTNFRRGILALKYEQSPYKYIRKCVTNFMACNYSRLQSFWYLPMEHLKQLTYNTKFYGVYLRASKLITFLILACN